MKYSIIIVTYNRKKELFSCLESIIQSSSAHLNEVIVVFNGDRSYLEKTSQNFKTFQTLFVTQMTPANARNVGAKHAKGEYLFFLDDDCILPENYFSTIDFDKNWDATGGPDQTPQIASPFQLITGQALSSPMCMGPTYKRHTLVKNYNTDANEQSLILCNFWIKASLFKTEGFQFNGNLFRNEENLLIKELTNANKVVHYNPSMFVYHQRKDGFEKLGASMIKSGECRIHNFSLLPAKKELIYLLPLLWFFALLYTLFHPPSILLSAFVFYTFFIILYHAITCRSFSLRYIFLHYFILTTYSIGLLKGLLQFTPLLYSNLKVNKSFIKESRSK